MWFISCENELNELRPSAQKEVKVRNGFFRDYESALSIAESYVFGQRTSETRANHVAAVKDHYMFAPISTRSTGGNALFHVINFEDEKGFALVSADTRATEVYAYGDEGSLYLNNVSEESAWDDFTTMAAAYYEAEIRSPSDLKIDTFQFENPRDSFLKYGDVILLRTEIINGMTVRVRSSDTTIYAGTPLSTLWDQCSPYNYYYPTKDGLAFYYDGRMRTGCVPIAIGQIATHYRHPAKYNNDVFDWDDILSKSNYLPLAYNQSSFSIARLIYDISVAGGARLDKKDPGMTFEQAKQIFTKFNYNYKYSDYSSNKVWNTLENGTPVYIRGTNTSPNEKSDRGHAWVIDAGIVKSTKETYYYDKPPYDIYGYGHKETMYLRCNWGWGNDYPAAYCLDVFTAPYDETFSISPKIIYDIEPKP